MYYNLSVYCIMLYIEVVLKAIGLAKVVLTFTLTFNLLSFSLGKIRNNLFVRHTLNGPSWPWSYGSWIYNYLCNQCLSPLMLWVRISIRARCTALCDKVCQWLATGRRFSLGPPISFANKTDRHDITEKLLNVALRHHKP